MKILISCYACSPNKGSEPGMGWNFVTGLSKFHEVHVIVEKQKWKNPILEYLVSNPQSSKNLFFYFIKKKRNKLLRKIWPPSYYWYYKKWQRLAYDLALLLDKKEDFDIIHQLNMVGYREPGFLWRINKPFVWGPIGGLENSPWKFLPKLGTKGFLYFSGRNILNKFQRSFYSRPKKAATRLNSRLIAATPSISNSIKILWGRDSDIIPEVGKDPSLINLTNRRDINCPLIIVWSGLHKPGKNLPLLLDSLSLLNINFKLHILGAGEMTNKWIKKSNKLGLNNKCIWHGWVEHSNSINIMKKGHLLCITSISDLTSTVTIEALTCGLPIICLDHCGFSYMVNNDCGIKVPINTYKQAVLGFSQAIMKIDKDEEFRINLSKGALLRAEEFNWDNKIKRMNNIYRSFNKI